MKLRHFFDHPAFVAANADAVRAARDTLPAAVRDRARVVFTAHSVPTAADAAAGTPSEGGHRYSRQVADAARLVAAELGLAEHDVVWQSRSGPPQVPWLGPDIVDHLDTLAAAGVPAVVVAPVGFVSDHVEVIWDLDTEARERARSWASRSPGRRRRARTRGSRTWSSSWSPSTPPPPRRARCRRTCRPRAAPSTGMPCAVDCCVPTRRPAGR